MAESPDDFRQKAERTLKATRCPEERQWSEPTAAH